MARPPSTYDGRTSTGIADPPRRLPTASLASPDAAVFGPRNAQFVEQGREAAAVLGDVDVVGTGA